MSQSNRKTWVSVVDRGVIIAGVLAVSAVGGTAYFIFRHVHTQFIPTETRRASFTDARARFAGQQPLLEIRKGEDEPVLHREVIPKRCLRQSSTLCVSSPTTRTPTSS